MGRLYDSRRDLPEASRINLVDHHYVVTALTMYVHTLHVQEHGAPSTPSAHLLNYRVILSKESTLLEDSFGMTKNPKTYSSASLSVIVFGGFLRTSLSVGRADWMGDGEVAAVVWYLLYIKCPLFIYPLNR